MQINILETHDKKNNKKKKKSSLKIVSFMLSPENCKILTFSKISHGHRMLFWISKRYKN